jgi:large subunit ribosomal protein L9
MPNMKVILLEDVPRLGKAGEVVEVKRGYGANYLLLQKKAEMVSKGKLKEIEGVQEQIRQKATFQLKKAQDVRDKIQERPLTVHMKAGEGGKLYGAVTGIAVAKAIKAQMGIEIDRRDVTIPEPIKIIGTHTINVKLHPQVVADIRIDVEPEKSEK